MQQKLSRNIVKMRVLVYNAIDDWAPSALLWSTFKFRVIATVMKTLVLTSSFAQNYGVKNNAFAAPTFIPNLIINEKLRSNMYSSQN